MKRVIRLKEYEPNSTTNIVPPTWYADQCDASFINKPYTIRVDANGFIVGSSVENAAGKLVILGDSVVESMFVDEDARFARVLQDKLIAEKHLRVEILNAGYSGATLLHSFNVFLNKIVPLRPSAVLLMTGIVDEDVAGKRASFWSTDCWLEPIIGIDDRNTRRDSDNLRSPSYQDRTRLLSLLKAAGDGFQIPLWFATVPHRQIYEGDYVRKKFPELANFTHEVAKRRLMNQNTRQFALKHDVTLFDLELFLAHRTDLFYDMFHLNALGSAAVADTLLACGIAEVLETAV